VIAIDTSQDYKPQLVVDSDSDVVEVAAGVQTRSAKIKGKKVSNTRQTACRSALHTSQAIQSRSVLNSDGDTIEEAAGVQTRKSTRKTRKKVSREQ
jgi:hypothetical protein